MQRWGSGRLSAAAWLAVLMLASWDTAAAQDFAGREKLRAHGEQEFRKDIVTVADGVYVAVGYSMANVTLIVGDGGTIIVDTTSKVDDAQAVKAEFAKISSAPVRAIIYTHSHPDHTGGASVFAGTDRPEIYSHQLFVDRVPDLGRAGRDGGDQFGSTLPEALYINGGTGTEFGRPSGPAAMKTGPLPPTKTFSGDRLALTIAGVRLELLHTPGETNDGISVWLPDTRVLLTGDLFLKAFPNLYAIRGAAPRPVMTWVGSLTRLIALGAEHVVPGHTRPVLGATNARDALTAYRGRDPVRVRPDARGHEEGRTPRRTGRAREAAAAPGGEPLSAGVLRHRGMVGARDLQRPPGVVRRQRHAPVSDAGDGTRAEDRGSGRWRAADACHAAGRRWPAGISDGPPSLRTACWPWTPPTSRRSASRRRR